MKLHSASMLCSWPDLSTPCHWNISQGSRARGEVKRLWLYVRYVCWTTRKAKRSIAKFLSTIWPPSSLIWIVYTVDPWPCRGLVWTSYAHFSLDKKYVLLLSSLYGQLAEVRLGERFTGPVKFPTQKIRTLGFGILRIMMLLHQQRRVQPKSFDLKTFGNVFVLSGEESNA